MAQHVCGSQGGRDDGVCRQVDGCGWDWVVVIKVFVLWVSMGGVFVTIIILGRGDGGGG